MKGLGCVFSVSLAKSLGAKSFMLLCGALLGLSLLPWKREKRFFPFFWIETSKLIISTVPHRDEVDTKRVGLLTLLGRWAVAERAAKPFPLQKKAALQRDAVPAHPPAAERAHRSLGANKCLVRQRDSYLITP